MAGYLREVLALANRAMQGESVSKAAAADLGALGVQLLEELRLMYQEKATEPTTSVAISESDRDSLMNSRYRATTVIPLVDNPRLNVRALDQEGLDSLLEGYETYAEFMVAIEPLDSELPE